MLCLVVFRGMYRFAMVRLFFLFVWILTNLCSVLCVLMFFECLNLVNVILCLMFVSSPPNFTTISLDMPFARGVLIGLCGVFLSVGASFLLFACVGVE